jgi:hypothetical protein
VTRPILTFLTLLTFRGFLKNLKNRFNIKKEFETFSNSCHYILAIVPRCLAVPWDLKFWGLGVGGGHESSND